MILFAIIIAINNFRYRMQSWSVFTNHLLFNELCQFLTIKEVLGLASLSQTLKVSVEHYCKMMLKDLNLKPTSLKSSTHQMQFYFNRCLRIFNIGFEDLRNVVTLYSPFKFQTIKLFQVGTTYATYLTRDNRAHIFTTQSLVRYYEQISIKKDKANIQNPRFETINNVKDIRSKSDCCVVVKVNGEVNLISKNKKDDTIIVEQQYLGWSKKIPVASVSNSYGYSIFTPENQLSYEIARFDIFGTKQNVKPNQVIDYSIFIGKNMLNRKQFLIYVPCDEIIEISVGNRYSYFLSKKNVVFEADCQERAEQNDRVIKARIFEPFLNKTIVKIANGYNYFIALERHIENLEQWDTERVVEWLKEIGFEAYIKIARYQKLDGRKLNHIEKKYMHNVLGITTQNMQQKFLMSIDQNLHRKSNKDQLWGWGKNQSCQLGSSSANFIVRPQKIRLNLQNEGQYIDSIFCGWFQTFIRTQKGRIYHTIRPNKKAKNLQNDQFEDEEQVKQYEKKIKRNVSQSEAQELQEEDFRKKDSKNKNHKPNIKKKRKNTDIDNFSHKLREKNKKKFEEEQNWAQLTLGKGFLVQTYKETIFLIQCPTQQKEQMKTKKLRTAKSILDKILWSNLNKGQFKVGYLDKDMGIIQISAIDMEKFDAKENRIKYFKKNNILVWDRELKIDLI